MIPRRYVLIAVALLVVQAIVSASMHVQMPDRVPVHWNIQGEPDGWGPRWQLTVLFPAINAGVLVLLSVLPLLGPFRRNLESFRQTYGKICICVLATMFVIGTVCQLAAAGWPIRIGTSIAVVVGVMLALLGNWMGKVRRNFWVGIRTPWTLANEVVWEKTHRLGGRLFVAAGLVTAVSALLLPEWAVFVVVMSSVLGTTLIALVYSYVAYRRVGQVDDLP